jgi:hypothetical protein
LLNRWQWSGLSLRANRGEALPEGAARREGAGAGLGGGGFGGDRLALRVGFASGGCIVSSLRGARQQLDRVQQQVHRQAHALWRDRLLQQAVDLQQGRPLRREILRAHGEDDHGCFRVELADALHQVQAVHPRHADVGEQEVDRVAGHMQQRRLGR